MGRIIELSERKLIMLEMMDYIDSFCRKNNIKYFLYGGSLIGAIRHNGYIPWDDDIDICMLREDYDRFLGTFSDPSKRYCLITPDNNAKFYLPTAKVYDDYTILNEGVPSGIDIGVFIDVFPLDFCSNEYKATCKYGSRIGFFRKILNIKNISISKQRKLYKNIILLLLKLSVLPFNKQYVIKKISNLSSKFKTNKTKYIGQFTKMTYESREIYETAWFDNVIDVSFEGHIFCAPEEYDRVLRAEFGEYMKLPPKEKQISHHGCDAWWK